uniref:Uncharacterized protein n=1 Tax=Ascaris lumbricoides TaxID=6252 RepID=A0A0M3IG67_ASCLU
MRQRKSKKKLMSTNQTKVHWTIVTAMKKVCRVTNSMRVSSNRAVMMILNSLIS